MALHQGGERMDEVKRRILVALILALVLAGAGGYQWWQSSRQPTVTTIVQQPQAQHVAPVPNRSKLTVYITGAVHRPGLYEIDGGLRVLDVVNLAGGLIPGADGNRINMAQAVKDGMHIAVPMTADNSPVQASKAIATGGEKVSINQAGKAELEKLPGIGPVLAERIIEYRQSNGLFQDIADIQKVTGIGEAKFKQIASKLRI